MPVTVKVWFINIPVGVRAGGKHIVNLAAVGRSSGFRLPILAAGLICINT